MDREHKAVIKEVIAQVNRTLPYYEKDFISVQRTPWTEKERCQSLEQFVEARFNFELSRVEEFAYLEQVFEGRLFGMIEMKDPDPDQRKFKQVTLMLPPDPIVKEVLLPVPELSDLIYDEIAKIRNYLGGNVIKFNAVRKKIKIIIEKNDC